MQSLLQLTHTLSTLFCKAPFYTHKHAYTHTHTHSDYTKVAHGLCDNVVIPLKTNVNDFANRAVPMLEELYQMRQKKEARRVSCQCVRHVRVRMCSCVVYA
jgi:hypothetical protein